MGAFAVNDTSEIHIDDQYLTIRIAHRACAAWVWALITGLVQIASKQADDATTGVGIAHVSLVRSWRYRALDWLSQIVYPLMMPVDHFLAQLDQEIDLSFVDDQCLPKYKWRPGKPGRPPWPPQLMFRLLLLMFLYGVPFETVLVAELQINIAWRWFIGLGLLEKTPDHSTLCDFRQRLGPEVFVQVLARLLSICLERGLIRNVDLYFDFTAVHASGVLFKPYQRALLLALAVNRYLDLLEAKRALDQPPLETLRSLVIEVAMEAIDSKSLDKVSPERLEQSLARLEEKVSGMPQGPHWQEPVEQVVQEAAATECSPKDRKGLLRLARKLLAVLPQSRGDLDARLGKANNWEFCFGYLAGYVVDGLFGPLLFLPQPMPGKQSSFPRHSNSTRHTCRDRPKAWHSTALSISQSSTKHSTKGN